MRKIIEVIYYNINKVNDYIQKNNIQEDDVISLTHIDNGNSRFSPYGPKIVLYHYEVVKEF